MRQIIINDELMNNEQLYYYQNGYGWYHCKYFTFREDYCYIDTNRPIQKSFYLNEKELLPYYSCSYDISFKTIKGKKYALFELTDTVYKIPFDYYSDIIETLYCDVYAYDYDKITFINTNDKSLIFLDNDEIIGWIEPCVFEVFSYDYYIDENAEFIRKDIVDNFIFKAAKPFINGFSKVIYDDFCAKLDSNGNIVQKLNCEDSWFYDNYTSVKIGGRWGIIDLHNNFIIPPKYEEIYYIQDNIWQVTFNNKKGLIDNNDNILIDIVYDDITPYKDRSYLIVSKDSLMGVINVDNNVVVPLEYSTIWYCYINNSIKNNYLYALKNGFAGIINLNNDIIIPFDYKELFYLSKNTVAAKLDNEKYILINENNKQICPTIFNDIHENFDSTDIYPAKLNGKWGFIDELGNVKINFKYIDVGSFSDDGYCEVSIKDQELDFNNYGLIDKYGNLILDYDYCLHCTRAIDSDRFVVEKNINSSCIVDKNNNIIIDEYFDWILPFGDCAYFPARLHNERWGFINRDGKVLKINKESLNIPITPINYNTIVEKDMLTSLFNGKVL